MRAQDRRRLVRVWRDLPPPRRNVIGDVPVLLGLLVVFAFFGFVFTELIWPVVLAGLLGGLLCLLALLSWVVWRFGGRGEGLLHPSTRTLVLVDRAGTVEAILELDAQAEGVLVSLRGNREEVRGEDPTRVSLIHQGTERFLTTTGSRAEALELLDHLGVPVGTGGRR